MIVEHVRDTKGGMRVYKLDGVLLHTNPGSTLESILHQLSQFGKPYFTSMDFKGNQKRISEALSSLYRKGALSRSKGIISLRGNERFYLYFSHKLASLHDRLVEQFLAENLPDRIVDIYDRIKYGKEILSNYDIRSEYGTVDLTPLENYIRNGLLASKHIKKYQGRYVDATFYYSPELEQNIDRIIEEKLELSIQKRHEAMKKGREFESLLYEALSTLFETNRIAIQIFEFNKQVRKQLPNGKLRIFDLVAYAIPVIEVNGKWKRLKWFHGSITIVFEFKYNFRVTKGFLAEYYLDVKQAYGDLAIPALVVDGSVYDSAWEFCRHYGIWIITGSSLETLLNASMAPPSQASPLEVEPCWFETIS
ncbi:MULTISPECIES: hypothetical protein [unclassified Archaeoglobus]|jgi:hypothetical protein|uniref:hypothetical protein n=1 Tax=unclassified Archaeoglobus TaxID=2643606 RepID=UPI0025BDC3DD|nr:MULTISPECIES: hypothetical protein [unclassified Archaeoglobus]